MRWAFYNVRMLGIGIDIVSVKRVRRVRARHPTRFPARILHIDEMPEYRRSADKDAFLARRFAAKEAVGKALGSGFNGLAARAIRILHDQRGRPEVMLSRDALPALPEAGRVLVSIADEKDYATATALAVPPM